MYTGNAIALPHDMLVATYSFLIGNSELQHSMTLSETVIKVNLPQGLGTPWDGLSD